MPFKDLGLSPELLKALKPKTYPAPTPVQLELIPYVFTGRDAWVTAPTGSGKTLAYTLPLIEQLARSFSSNTRFIRALVLVPTRELAIQVGQTFMSLTAHWGSLCKITVVFGGVSINPQMMGLRGGTDILIATPGRLIDLMANNALKLSHVQTLVLDEADKLFELGFQEELQTILQQLPTRRQTLLLSATKPSSMQPLAQALLQDPLVIHIQGETQQPAVIVQRAIYTDVGKRTQLLKHLIQEAHLKQVLVFAATQHSSEIVAAKLRVAGIAAEPFHGQLSQGKRQQVLADFKAQRVEVVLATDLAARGLDIKKLPAVVNFDLPVDQNGRADCETYLHRIGRTGRFGKSGVAINLVDGPRSMQVLQFIESHFSKSSLSNPFFLTKY